MKILLIFLAFSMPTMCFSQWNGMYYHGDQESKMAVLNNDTIIAVCNWDGRIHRITNGGISSTIVQTEFTTSWFSDVQFPTSSVGYACGGTAFGNHTNVIVRTTDAGLTWDSITSNNYPGYSFSNIHFITPDLGFVAQENGNILKTVNGCTNFTEIPIDGFLTELTAKPNETLFIARRKNINATTIIYFIDRSDDLGDNWTTVYTDTLVGGNGNNHRDVNSIFFLDNSNGYAVGGSGLFLKTTDGGATWAQSFLNPYTNLTALHFTSPDVGYVNNAGGIYRTEDGGISWTVQNLNLLTIIHQIVFVNDTIGYALGDQGIYNTTNAGMILGVNEINKTSDFPIYPNPTSGLITIPLDQNVVSVSAFNQLGQKIAEFEETNELDISSLPDGIYMLLISTKEGQIMKRVVKE